MLVNIRNSCLQICSQCFSFVSQHSSCLKCSLQRLSFSTSSFIQPLRSKSRSWISSSSLSKSRLLSDSSVIIGVPISRFRSSFVACTPLDLQPLTTSRSFPSAITYTFATETKCSWNTTFPPPIHDLCRLPPSTPGHVRPYTSSGPIQPPKKKSKDDSGKSPISWKNLVIVAGIAGVFLVSMNYVRKEKELERQKARNRKMGKAALGGEWELTNHHGKRQSSKDFHGQWVLIYFGFTNCPDICPEEIEKIVEVISKTDKDKDMPSIQPILITVDPERDTPEALKEYLSEFSPRILGFSGTKDDIDAATRAYRVYYSAGPKDEDNDYIVDHSIISYLVNPRGEFVDYFGQNKKAEEMYNSIKLHIYTYNRGGK